jgi:catechol 2,3-dioxygenase-like lactoylglutathione lyase family enzyme
MIKGMHHVAISTANLERLCRFYCDHLGFKLLAEMDWEPGSELGVQVDHIAGLQNTSSKLVFVSIGNLLIEIFEYRSPTPKPVDKEWRGYDHGYTHICLEVDDIDEAYDKLQKAGMTFRNPPPSKPYEGMRCLYGRDPEGHMIEFIQMHPQA